MVASSRKATLHDVAKRAHVSVASVSNYLNDYPYMKPATRERIQQAIDEGITVVNFDIAIDADGVYRVSGDNYDMGYQSAQYIRGQDRHRGHRGHPGRAHLRLRGRAAQAGLHRAHG